MRLEYVEAINFRNLKGKIDLEPGLSILVGENGQGKTNWLEAINVLATTRSFKTGKIAETIRFGEDLAMVQGEVRQSQELHRTLRVNIQKTIKSCLVNGKQETTQRYLHELHAVVFNADELEIIRGLPEARRRFLDAGIISLHPPFTQTFTDYAKVLRQKNSLLQQAREKELSVEKTAELLEPWNEQLTAHAAKIHRGRTRFVERINEVLEKRLFGREELSIRYVSSLEGKGDLSDYTGLLAERLKLRVQAELVAGHSLVGSHRDDMEVLFDGQDIRKFGSSGQQRSALLLLQLANITVFHATRGEYPLFLLDDIDAELDHRRIGHLLEYLAGKTQTVVTTSKEGFVAEFGRSARTIRIENGMAAGKAGSAP